MLHTDPSPPLTLHSLPLFPLNTLLFPDGTLQLRVFEVRYLDMVRRCHQAGAPFGIVPLRQGDEVRRAGAAPEQLFDAGTLGTITRLESPQPGLILLECQGGQRFRINKSHQLPHGLWVADVQLLPADIPLPVPPHLQRTAQALGHVRSALQQGSAHPQPPDDCGWVANRWCELLPIPLELKQRMLQLDSPLVRLELVGDLLERTGIAP